MSETEQRILIVEDQRLIAADLESTLKKLGYAVVGIASSGDESVRKAGELGPDLVLMDIRLQGAMDGIEAAGLIRERFDLPVVYLTAYADEETIVRAKVTTPFGFVVKPFNARELRAAIEIALYKSRTERELAEERARRRAAEESRLLIESVTDYAIFRLDPGGRIASWNLGAERIQGYSADEVIGEHFSMLCSPEDIEAGTPQDLVERAVRDGHAEHEGWRVRKDSTRYWANVTLTAMHSDDGSVRGHAVVVRDLSEREDYERALRESEQRFRTAVIHAPVPMMLHAEDGEVLAVSDAVVAATGYSRERIRTLTEWLDLAYGERADEIRGLIEQSFDGDPPAPSELPVRTAGGEVRQWLFSVSAQLMLGAGRRGVVAVAVDVTKQRRAEEALRQSHREKDEFIAVLGHELRNPLAAIRSATELLKMTSKGDFQHRRVQEVLERQTTHMAKLIDDLLDVSQLIGGHISIEHDVLDLRSILQEAIQGRMAHLEQRGLELRAEFDEHSLWARGDRSRLQQAFDNLLANAIKFTQPPGCITVSAGREGDEAVVRVNDTGSGIEADLLPGIFEPFRQAKQSLDRAAGGLGLGLAIVKGVVELHEGSIAAVSQPGQGAEFIVRFPLCPAPEEHLARTPARVRPARVLIVEDNEDAADTLRTVLETIGNEVDVAYDGESALTKARSFHPEVILCDIGLPGRLSGYDVARALREDDDETFLVAVTGYGRPEDIRRSDEVGFDAHLTKPIDVATIEQLLARHRRAGKESPAAPH